MVNFGSTNAEFYFSKNTVFNFEPGSSIEVNGPVRIGYPLPGFKVDYPSFDKTVINLQKNSKLIFKGPTFISSGSSIWIKENAEVIFNGNNFLARNTTIIAANKVEYGKNTSSSWNFSAIDDDGHSFHDTDGKPIPRSRRELIIGDNVAIQINVTIPRGIKIGEGSIIGANTVLRQNIPSYSRVYGKQELDIKEGVTYGFQFINQDL